MSTYVCHCSRCRETIQPLDVNIKQFLALNKPILEILNSSCLNYTKASFLHPFTCVDKILKWECKIAACRFVHRVLPKNMSQKYAIFHMKRSPDISQNFENATAPSRTSCNSPTFLGPEVVTLIISNRQSYREIHLTTLVNSSPAKIAPPGSHLLILCTCQTDLQVSNWLGIQHNRHSDTMAVKNRLVHRALFQRKQAKKKRTCTRYCH